jgi:hypothetical protein
MSIQDIEFYDETRDLALDARRQISYLDPSAQHASYERPLAGGEPRRWEKKNAQTAKLTPLGRKAPRARALVKGNVRRRGNSCPRDVTEGFKASFALQ